MPNQNGPINWGTLISAGTLLAILVAAFWTIVQTQFGYIEKDKERISQQVIRTDAAIAAQLSKLKDDTDARFLVLRGRLEGFIDKRVADEVFKQHEARNVAEFETIKRQLQLIEQTRPTTGELKGTAESLTLGLSEVKERIRNLELRLIPQASPSK